MHKQLGRTVFDGIVSVWVDIIAPYCADCLLFKVWTKGAPDTDWNACQQSLESPQHVVAADHDTSLGSRYDFHAPVSP